MMIQKILIKKKQKKVLTIDMNPVSWTKKRGFYMTKLTYENRIEIYNKIKNGILM